MPSQFEKWSLSQRANVANPDRSCIYCQTRVKTSHLPGWPAPIGRPQSESVAKYVVVDMFAKACAGKSTKEVIADANAQLKQIFKTA